MRVVSSRLPSATSGENSITDFTDHLYVAEHSHTADPSSLLLTGPAAHQYGLRPRSVLSTPLVAAAVGHALDLR